MLAPFHQLLLAIELWRLVSVRTEVTREDPESPEGATGRDRGAFIESPSSATRQTAGVKLPTQSFAEADLHRNLKFWSRCCAIPRSSRCRS